MAQKRNKFSKAVRFMGIDKEVKGEGIEGKNRDPQKYNRKFASDYPLKMQEIPSHSRKNQAPVKTLHAMKHI